MTPEHPHGGAFDLSRVQHPGAMPRALREDAIIVSVLRNGDIFFRQERVAPDRLAGLIRERIRRGSENRVYIRRDVRVRYRA